MRFRPFPPKGQSLDAEGLERLHDALDVVTSALGDGCSKDAEDLLRLYLWAEKSPHPTEAATSRAQLKALMETAEAFSTALAAVGSNVVIAPHVRRAGLDHELANLVEQAADAATAVLGHMPDGQRWAKTFSARQQLVLDLAGLFERTTGEPAILVHDWEEDAYSGRFFTLVKGVVYALDSSTSDAALGRSIAKYLKGREPQVKES